MVQRNVAQYKGQDIGIESIYTVIDGKQINIPERLIDLRTKSRNNELFCPCGCGANLILVAGDKNLKEQHFRIKDGENNVECHYETEGRTSVFSKIVLKCWLDDNIDAADLEARVPICSVGNSERKYEFTFISKSKRIAIDYCHNRSNLSDEKQSILEENSKDIKIIHVVDYKNGGSEGQYPEGLMKIQSKQRYCLLLSVKEMNYETARMRAAFYEQDIDGLWKEIVFADGFLKEFRIDSANSIQFQNENLEESFEVARNSFLNRLQKEKSRREEERIRQEARKAQIKREQELVEAERARRLEEIEEYRKKKAEETEAKRLQENKEKAEKAELEREKRRADFLQERPKTELLYNILINSDHIKGRMLSLQGDGSRKSIKLDVDIEDVVIYTVNNSLIIKGNGKKGYLFVLELESDKENVMRSGGLFTNIDVRNIPLEDIKDHFENYGFELS